MTDLGELAERIECSAMESFYGAGPAVGIPAVTARDGSVLALGLEGSRDLMLNRAIGLGTELPATREGVDTLLDWFRER
ncbi:MAG TPA: hypothetical protein VFZ53_09200, partial [Polyangiaceae bacterium]